MAYTALIRAGVLMALCAGCTAPVGPVEGFSGGSDAGSDGAEPGDDGGEGDAPSPADAKPADDTGSPPGDSGGPSTDSGPGPGECYRESLDGGASLADLKASYSASKWLTTSLEALRRRYPDGHGILDAMKSDPQLEEFADKTSWSGLMASIDTMCHEETHGWDFENALKKPGKHMFWLRKDLALEAPKALDFFARSELVPMVGDAGTEMYDETYLTGEQGTYDFVFLADELNAYINGLACATAVGSEITSTYSFRDGAAAHLYYLELYLKRARTKYPALYAKMKASAEWMKFVRYEWARGHFWTEASKPFPNLGINDKKIWGKVNLAENLAEIEQFTGEKPTAVACKP